MIKRSEHKLEEAILRLLKFCHLPASSVHFSLKGSFWNLTTDKGISLFDPKTKPVVLAILIATFDHLKQEHADLLRLYLDPIPAGPHLHFKSESQEWALTVFYAAFADSLQLLLDEMQDRVKDRKLEGEQLLHALLPLLHKPRSYPSATHPLLDKRTVRAFEGILTEAELIERHQQALEGYGKQIEKAIATLLAKGHPKSLCEEIARIQGQTLGMGWEAKVKVFEELILPKLREHEKEDRWVFRREF